MSCVILLHLFIYLCQTDIVNGYTSLFCVIPHKKRTILTDMNKSDPVQCLAMWVNMSSCCKDPEFKQVKEKVSNKVL